MVKPPVDQWLSPCKSTAGLRTLQPATLRFVLGQTIRFHGDPLPEETQKGFHGEFTKIIWGSIIFGVIHYS